MENIKLFDSKFKFGFQFLCLILLGCSVDKPDTSNDDSVFKYMEKEFKINNIIQMPGAVNWIVDLELIKKTVVYKDLIISIGNNGGFLCLNAYTFELNYKMNKKLNSGFFNNLTLFQDTLIAEKFGKLYYLNQDTIWADYTNLQQIKYFDIIYDDKDFAIYSTDCGEWGSNTFFYDKNLHSIKVFYGNISCPVNVIRNQNSFYFNTLSDGINQGVFYKIDSLESIQNCPNPEYYFECRMYESGIDMEMFEGDIDISIYDKMYRKVREEKKEWAPKANLTTIYYNNKQYHFVNRYDSVMISVIDDFEYREIQIIPHFEPVKSRKFGNTLIMNEFYGGDFFLVRNDTIVRFKVETLNGRIYAPENHRSIKTISGITEHVRHTFNNDSKELNNLNGIPEREISYNFNGYNIYSCYNTYNIDNNFDCGIIISNVPLRYRLVFNSPTFNIWSIFQGKRGGNKYLYISYWKDEEYGLLEIQDIKKFAEYYKER